MKKLKAFAEAKNISLEENSSSMKERKKKVVCKTFHGAGLVVPVDENDVGYREVPETAGTIMHLYEYQHDRVLMVLEYLFILVLWMKAASALEGLR